MKRDFTLFLEDILESIERIEEYIQGIDLTTFNKDIKTQDAISRRIEIIGEAIKNIPPAYRNNYSLIP